MAQSRKRSPSGLSEAVKKTGRAIGYAARSVIGKKRAPRAKSPSGNLSEAAHKAGRGISDAARKAIGKRPSRIQKSGSR
jgi:hypothetical protein